MAMIEALTAIMIMATGAPPVPGHWIEDGHISGRECGAYTNVCWHALVDAGIGPLTIEPSSGHTWIRAIGRVLYCESRHQRYARNINRDGSIDRGIAQFNDRHWAEMSDWEADTPAIAIRKMVRLWRAGLERYWVCWRMLYG